MQWLDLGIVYTAPSSSSAPSKPSNAYYPSVTYDGAGFGMGASSTYRMWYSDGSTASYLTNSSDGIHWNTTPTVLAGLPTTANHIQVVYDPGDFGGGSYAYKAWYWDTNATLYSINAINYAESTDGINWTSGHPITQDPAQPLVTGISPNWNAGSYGPIDIHYQATASDLGSNPWNYHYVMYYDGTSGGTESVGLAYSKDGLDWSAYTGSPVLQGQAGSWDSKYTAYGTVIQQSPASYVYFYSGGITGTNEGIGLATSTDGLTWTKDLGNPIFDISQGVPYRNQRVYTPEVVLGGDGILRMYYSAVGNSGVKDIGLALNPVPNVVYVDDDYTPINAGGHIFGYNAFTSIQQAENQVAAGGTIYVYAGTYAESLIIDKSITLTSTSGAANTFIELPSAAPVSQSTIMVTISGAQNVTLDGFTIEGPGNGFGSIGYGVAVVGGASATITHNHITHVRDISASGTQNGVGILVGRQIWGTTGTATISYNTIDDYQKGGIVVDNTGSSAEIDHNTILGSGPTTVIAQNGIQISRGATADVHDNDISGNLYTPLTNNSTGILVFNSGAVTVDQNTVSQNDVGVSVTGAPSTVVAMTGNRIVGNTRAGLNVNSYTGTLDARNNWWGSNADPGSDSVVGPADFSPWLTLSLLATPSDLVLGGTNNLTATLNINSAGQTVAPASCLPDGIPVGFATDWGSVQPTNTATTGGLAQALLNAGAGAGPATISATVDNQTVSIILRPTPPTVVYVDWNYTPSDAGGHIYGYDAFTTIQPAENQVAAGGTVYVYPGTYPAGLIIDKSVTLTSTSGAADTIINGGDPYIVTIQASDVSLTGFTITNPAYTGGGDAAGVLVQRPNPDTPVSNVDILNNIITDVRSQSGGPSAFGVTGINIGFGGPTDVAIAGNVIKNIFNPDGSPTGDNTAGVNVWDNGTDITIRDNVFSNIKFNGVLMQYATDVLVTGNKFDDVPVAVNADPYDPSVAVTNLTVTSNVATGAGIHLLGTTNAVIADNTITGATDNGITIAGGSNNILITQNSLLQAENYGVFVGQTVGFPANSDVALQGNRIVGNSLGGMLVEADSYVGAVDARNNWWGSNAGPGGSGSDPVFGPADFSPWLTLHLIATPSNLVPGGTNTLTATLNINSEGTYVSPAAYLPDGTPVGFGTNWGSVDPTGTATTSGTAQALLMAGAGRGPATIAATVDNQTVSIVLTMPPGPPPSPVSVGIPPSLASFPPLGLQLGWVIPPFGPALAGPTAVGTQMYQVIEPFLSAEAAAVGALGGVVFIDVNGNGVRDADERGLANCQVILEMNVGGEFVRVDSTFTDENGSYLFTPLAPGSYRIFPVIPEGVTQISPVSDTYEVTVSDATRLYDLNFAVEIVPAVKSSTAASVGDVRSPAETPAAKPVSPGFFRQLGAALVSIIGLATPGWQHKRRRSANLS